LLALSAAASAAWTADLAIYPSNASSPKCQVKTGLLVNHDMTKVFQGEARIFC